MRYPPDKASDGRSEQTCPVAVLPEPGGGLPNESRVSEKPGAPRREMIMMSPATPARTHTPSAVPETALPVADSSALLHDRCAQGSVGGRTMPGRFPLSTFRRRALPRPATPHRRHRPLVPPGDGPTMGHRCCRSLKAPALKMPLNLGLRLRLGFQSRGPGLNAFWSWPPVS